MSEAALLEGCRRGERAAQKELYELHVERIYRLALRMTGDADNAFDVVQETFIRAFAGVGSFDGRSSLGTWLYRIATNEALSFFRRNAVRERHLRVVAEQRDEPADRQGGSIDDDVSDALSKLSDYDRAVLLLKYQENLSYDEIAATLDCAPGTVASRLNRARARLRKTLDGYHKLSEEAGCGSRQID